MSNGMSVKQAVGFMSSVTNACYCTVERYDRMDKITSGCGKMHPGERFFEDPFPERCSGCGRKMIVTEIDKR